MSLQPVRSLQVKPGPPHAQRLTHSRRRVGLCSSSMVTTRSPPPLLLEVESYEAVIARHSDEAQARIAEMPNSPDAIVSDFHLAGGRNGVENYSRYPEDHTANHPLSAGHRRHVYRYRRAGESARCLPSADETHRGRHTSRASRALVRMIGNVMRVRHLGADTLVADALQH